MAEASMQDCVSIKKDECVSLPAVCPLWAFVQKQKQEALKL